MAKPDAATVDRLKRDLILLPRGSTAWRKRYADFRRTKFWKDQRDFKLKEFPFCEMCALMNYGAMVPAVEVHHSEYSNMFEDTIVGRVSVCRKCHQLWENRWGRKH